MSDKQTLDVYAAQTAKYVDMVKDVTSNATLDAFLDKLPDGCHVLDWGCGAGNSAAQMLAQGFEVTATDASDAFATAAQETFGVDVRVETFAELQDTAAFDGIWASFSLLHAPKADMPAHLAAARRALKPGGHFAIGLKTGTGEHRDTIGRFYAYYEEDEIKSLLAQAGFTVTDQTTGAEEGLDGKMWPWIVLYAHA